MNIALALQQQMIAVIGRFSRFTTTCQWPISCYATAQRTSTQRATHFEANDAVPVRLKKPNSPQTLIRPLRVVRLMEAGQASASVGRMVISGRMADVCAELDRLAATEVALG